MDQGPIIESSEVFFCEIDVSLSYSTEGFSVRGRDKRQVAKIFTSIEPDIIQRIDEPHRNRFLNILYLLGDSESDCTRGDIVSISVYDAWYQGEFLTVTLGRIELYKVELLSPEE